MNVLFIASMAVVAADLLAQASEVRS